MVEQGGDGGGDLLSRKHGDGYVEMVQFDLGKRKVLKIIGNGYGEDTTNTIIQ